MLPKIFSCKNTVQITFDYQYLICLYIQVFNSECFESLLSIFKWYWTPFRLWTNIFSHFYSILILIYIDNRRSENFKFNNIPILRVHSNKLYNSTKFLYNENCPNGHTIFLLPWYNPSLYQVKNSKLRISIGNSILNNHWIPLNIYTK